MKLVERKNEYYANKYLKKNPNDVVLTEKNGIKYYYFVYFNSVMMSYTENGNSLFRNIYLTIRDLYYGLLVYKYPSCCVIEFIRDSFQQRPSGLMRRLEYGNEILDTIHGEHVPCNKCIKNILKNNLTNRNNVV